MSRIRRIERLITNAELRLSNKRQEVDKVLGELEELRKQLEEVKLADSQLPLPLERKSRGLSEKWGAVLNFMVIRSPNPVSLDEILQFAADNDLKISRAAARAQLHNYTQRGLVERIGDGLYSATNAARDYCDY